MTPSRTPVLVRARAMGAAVLLLALAACAPPAEDAPPEVPEVPEVMIRGQDYAFELTDSVPAGMVYLGFENVGEVPHEVVVVQLNDGVTPDQIAAVVQGEADPGPLMAGMVGILIANPGQTALGRLAIELEAGRTYALVCNFTDDENAPPHTALGMIRLFVAT